jgi:hypothetical protein
VVFNVGGLPDDPKVDRARELGAEFHQCGWGDEEENRRDMAALLRSTRPDLVVFGEDAFPGMVPFLEGAKMGRAPLVMLDQFYRPGYHGQYPGVDLLLTYGLRCLWENAADRPGHLIIVPPFIDEVTPVETLGAPPGFEGLPWVTVLGLDERVLRAGIELIGKLERHRPAVITVSRDPALSERLMGAAGIGPERRLALPLQRDPELFGWIAASRVAIVANGFMQIVEALALGTPALSIDRGLGLPAGALDEAFLPYVSHCETPGQQLARLDGWLEGRPFPEGLLAGLQRERSGLRRCVDLLEAAAARPRLGRRLQRALLWLRWRLRRLSRPPQALPESRMEHGDR